MTSTVKINRRDFLTQRGLLTLRMGVSPAAHSFAAPLNLGNAPPRRKCPNLLFIMADDHAPHAIGAYGSRINKTPNIYRIAQGCAHLDH